MKSYRKELWFNVFARRVFINITPDVQKCIDERGVSEGLVSSMPSKFSYASIRNKFNAICSVWHL